MPSHATLLDHVRQAMRFNGLWWRQLAYLGSVYGPEWWKSYSPPFFAAAIFALIGANRRGSMTNMRHVLGTDDTWTAGAAALRMFAEFSYCMSETLEYYSPRQKPLRLENPEDTVITAALRAGRGVVLVTGHFGNWDIAAKTLSDYGRPINVVMAHDANVSAQEYVRTARERAGVRVIFSDSSVFSSLNMVRALRGNEIVALQLDRMVHSGGARLLPFFGHPAPFPSGPFALARITGAPVVPVFIPRLGRRHYAIHVGDGVHVPREARDGAALDRVMMDVVRQFEAMVHRYPMQWFQFAPFWPEEVVAGSEEERGEAAARVR